MIDNAECERSVIQVKAEEARKLAIRLAEVMQDWDAYEYANTLADYDNNEELLLEDLEGRIASSPESVMDEMLQVMNNMLDCIC